MLTPMLRGYERCRERSYDLAIADYTRALQLDPGERGPYIARADALKRKGEFARAIADLAELIRLDPQDVQGHRQLAWILSTCPDDRIRDGKRAFDLAKHACVSPSGKTRGVSTPWPRPMPSAVTLTQPRSGRGPLPARSTRRRPTASGR